VTKGGLLPLAAVALVGLAVALAAALLVAVAAFAGQTAGSSTTTGLLNTSAIPATIQSVVPYLERAGQLCSEISAPFLAAQISVESAWDPNAVSSAGAEGLAQFMPSTWPHWGANDDGTGDVSPFNPNDAVMAQGRYNCASASAVASLVRPGDDLLGLVLAAYDDGPGAVLAYGGIPPTPGLQTYISKVEGAIATYEVANQAPGAGGSGQAVVAAAERELGVPYSWGGGNDFGPTLGFDQGASTVGFDCSGLVLYAIYQASGGTIALPHSSETQVTMGQAVTPTDLEPGDVIGFALGADRSDYDHIGIYVGNGTMIDAPETGTLVRFDNLDTTYWRSVPWSARRFLQ
jgi:hypothetical protein